MTPRKPTPADVHGQVDEAQRTLRKLNGLWDELWSQQFDPPPKRENDEIVEKVRSGPPGSRALHLGNTGPFPLEQHYLNVQHALRDAWRTLGGTWHTDYSGTLPPVAMRRIARLLSDMLADDVPPKVAGKACRQIMDGWWGLPEGLRGEPKGGARRCTHCTDPAEKGRTKCGRHKYAKNRPDAA